MRIFIAMFYNAVGKEKEKSANRTVQLKIEPYYFEDRMIHRSLHSIENFTIARRKTNQRARVSYNADNVTESQYVF